MNALKMFYGGNVDLNLLDPGQLEFGQVYDFFYDEYDLCKRLVFKT